MQDLIDIINDGFERRESLADDEAELQTAIDEAISLLDAGSVRVAEKIDNEWLVNQWLKKAVLLSFRLADNRVIPGQHSNFYDKVPMKYAGYDEQQFRQAGVRVVPDAIVRRGAYVAPGDLALRHDIQRLADHGIITGTVTTWPLAWGPILEDIEKANATELPAAIADSLLRVKQRADWETRTDAIGTSSACCSGRIDPRRLRRTRGAGSSRTPRTFSGCNTSSRSSPMPA